MTKEIEDSRKAIAEVESRIRPLVLEKYALQDKLLSALSSLKIGDHITFSHGKGVRKGVIERMWFWCSDEVGYTVRTIKKDGTEGDRCDVRPYQKPKLEET